MHLNHGAKSAKFWKNKYFPYLWAFLQRSMSAFLKIPVFLGWILRILWSEVTNNYGVPKIHVFLGWILKILWSKVTNIYGVPEIHVFLYPEMFKFMLWVSFLAGVINWDRCAEFRSLLLLERFKIRVKIYIFWAIWRCVIDALSNSVCAGGKVRKHTYT